MRPLTLRAASAITTVILAAAAVPVLAGTAQALVCADSADCAATATGGLPLAPGPTVGDDPEASWVLGDRLLFVSSTPETGRELWRSDLTQSGTGPVTDINIGPDDGVRGTEAVVLGGYLYFVGDDFVRGSELWRSDGTAAGTTLFHEGRDGTAGGDPRHLTVAGGKLYWRTFNGSSWDLWVSDGTPAGTHLVVDLGGEVTSTFDATPVPAGGKVYFLALVGGVKNLAVTDGTAAGTKILRPFPGGVSWFFYPRFRDDDHRVQATGDVLYFNADDGSGHGRELWVSDGTPAGTAEVLDLSPGSASSNLRAVGVWNGGFYFYNGGATAQYEVYRVASGSAVQVGWRTFDVTTVLGRDADAFYFARSIGLSSAEVVRVDEHGAVALEEPGLAVQSVAGGVLHGDTFFASLVVQGAGDKILAFDAASGDRVAGTTSTTFAYRAPTVFRGRLVVPASDNAGPWHLVSRFVQPVVGNVVAPSVAGTARVGSPLVARVGTWTPGASFSYQWLRGGAPIPGATRATYTPVPSDLGRALAIAVTGSKAGHVPATVTSAARVVARGVLVGATPKIVGKVRVGRVLRAAPGRWTPGTVLTYRWFVGGKPVAGAKARTFRLKAKNRGKRILVRVTGAKPGYTTITRRSAATARVR